MSHPTVNNTDISFIQTLPILKRIQKRWKRLVMKEIIILALDLYLSFLSFLFSETLLFVSLFWTSFHSFSCPSLGISPLISFYLPLPSSLTFSNTLLLSNGGISLGNSFVSLEISSSFIFLLSFFSFIHGWTFISLQIKEFSF